MQNEYACLGNVAKSSILMHLKRECHRCSVFCLWLKKSVEQKKQPINCCCSPNCHLPATTIHPFIIIIQNENNPIAYYRRKNKSTAHRTKPNSKQFPIFHLPEKNQKWNTLFLRVIQRKQKIKTKREPISTPPTMKRFFIF